MTAPNNLLQAESDIVNLLQHSPVMPPTILVRPFEESLIESGRVFSNDNILVKFVSIDTEPTVESEDEIVHKWKVTFEIMLLLRDLRGHHPALQLIETVMMLLTNYNVLTSSRALAPRNARWTEYDENKFRYWSIMCDYEMETCMPTYMDPFEPIPPELRCVDPDCMWTGFNENGDINTCWRRYRKPGENKWRHYNSCSQKPGDETRNVYFDTDFSPFGSRTPEFDDRIEEINTDTPFYIVQYPGIGDVTIFGRIPTPPVKVNLGLFRSTSIDGFYPLGTKSNENLVGNLEVETGEGAIVSSKVCTSCGI